MERFYIEKTRELRRNLKSLEKKLGVKIKLEGRKVTISGTALDEYETSLVLEAIRFGYSVETSLTLTDEETTLEIIKIKDYSRKKNIREVRARLIGTHGQTKKTIEHISGCKIIIRESEVGILGDADGMEYAITAITNIIRGSKQSNVYKYLERINKKDKIKKIK